ncbi:hypothetical protein PC123_g16302 [Phytophthora cactorum]|nr:hypothetical protein PC123_g16302 [Phytophthora cactorum]
MTGLRGLGPSDHLPIPRPVERTTLEETQATQRENVERLQNALKMMHRRSTKVNSAARAAGRKGHDKKQGTAMPQFDTGDNELYADVW